MEVTVYIHACIRSGCGSKLRGRPTGFASRPGRIIVIEVVKGKGKGAGLLSDIKSEDLSSDFTSYPLVAGPVHSCAISTPRRAYSPAAVSAHWTYRTHCHLCPTRYSFSPESSEAFEGEVPCPRTQHLNNVPRLRGEKHYIPLKILHQAGFETARQAATSAERHALTIAPCQCSKQFKIYGVCSAAVYGTLHFKEPWSHSIRARNLNGFLEKSRA